MRFADEPPLGGVPGAGCVRTALPFLEPFERGERAMSKEELYQFAVIKHPTEDERKKGARSKIVLSPSEFILARSEQEVMLTAVKRIPEDEMEDADRLEVAIRPF